MQAIDIAEVARQAGIPASALRFYEEKGLIKSIGRHGLRRLFDPAVVQQLALISLGRAAGFSLEEIAQMFAPNGKLRIDRKQLNAKADELDQAIKRLVAMRDGLRHAAECPAPTHLECPKFVRMIRLASTGRFQPQRRIPKKAKQRL